MTKKERAGLVYKSLCDFIDSNSLKSMKIDEDKSVILSVKGEDFVISVMYKVDEESEQALVYSKLPFEIPVEKTVDMVRAISYINSKLSVGKFSINTLDRSCVYQSSVFFAGLSGFSTEFAENVILTAFGAIEKYDDKLYAVNKGLMSVKDFAGKI